MLAEFLTDRGGWTQVMPGARACLFSLREGPLSLPLRLEPLHFEVLFCLGRVNDSDPAGRLDPDGRGPAGAAPHRPLQLDRRKSGQPAGGHPGGGGCPERPRESLQTIFGLLGNLSLDTGQVRRWMADRGGCTVEGPTHWSRAAFADLDRLPHSEQARWCVWKSVELLYLLCNPKGQENVAPALERETARRLADIRRYMEEHLDEPLTISTLSRRACLSATTFKESFRRLYGLPVHAWLRQRRMERAAKLLQDSSLSVLGVAQAVGYGSVSQFSAAFRRQYGLTPAQYRKNV